MTIFASTDTVQVLANTKKRWLLILDNADDPNPDYQMFLPSGKHVTIIITSRMSSCCQYNMITLESLRYNELIEQLLKASRIPQNSCSSYVPQAEKVINVLPLGSHNLAVIQAGAFIAAGHCELDQYVKLFDRQRKRMLSHRSVQALSRYGVIDTTFYLATAILNDKSECGMDALCLLEVLSILHCSHVPF